MASVTVDPRNGRIRVRAYAGIDPASGTKRYLGESLPKDAPDARVAEACARLDARAAYMKETGRTLTLDGLVQWYLDELSGAMRPPGTVKTYRSYYFRHISPRRGSMPADDVMPFMLSRDLAAAVRGDDREPICARTANGIHALLHAAYAAALADGIVDRNPMAVVPKLTVDESDDVRVFDDREMPVLIEWMDSRSSSWLEVVLKGAASLALDTGLRVGEICALRPRDHRKGSVRVSGSVTEAGGVHRKATKSGRKRTVSLDPEAEGRLCAFESSRFLWTGARTSSADRIFTDERDRELKPSTLSAGFSQVCFDLGLGEGRRFHELRHTHATWLLEGGTSLKVVSERLGHASEAFTLRTYGHVLPGRDMQAASDFGKVRGTFAEAGLIA